MDTYSKIEEIFRTELLPLLTSKGHDYSGEVDPLSNLRDFGWEGVVVRIGDKYHRLKNFVKVKELQVKNETIEDTLKDLINYGLLCLVLLREESERENLEW